MNDFKKVFFYLKGFIGLSIIVIVTSLVSCFFEGVSIGILVPILQSMMSKSSVVSINLPFFDRFQHFFAGWGQKQVLPFLIIFVFFAILLKNFLRCRKKYRSCEVTFSTSGNPLFCIDYIYYIDIIY